MVWGLVSKVGLSTAMVVWSKAREDRSQEGCKQVGQVDCALHSSANAMYASGDAVASKRDQKCITRQEAPCALVGRVSCRAWSGMCAE